MRDNYLYNKLMPHLTNKNPFKNQGLAIFVALRASFGKRFGKKKLFKINEMPRMARMTHQKRHSVNLGLQEKKKQVKRNVNEM